MTQSVYTYIHMNTCKHIYIYIYIYTYIYIYMSHIYIENISIHIHNIYNICTNDICNIYV